MTAAQLLEAYPPFLAALCTWREGRGQSQNARRGIWHTIQNRVGKPLFRPSIVRVVLQPWAFSSFNTNDPNVSKFPNEAIAMDWQAWLEILEIAENPGDDPTGVAVYYESLDPSELDAARAKDPWFAVEKLTVQIDQVRFYRA